jgi:hypothetical protein
MALGRPRGDSDSKTSRLHAWKPPRWRTSKKNEMGESPLQEKLKWRKSSYSGQNGGDCVEYAVPTSQAEVLVRDSKNAQGPRLGFTTQAWAQFVQAAATDSVSPAV